MLVNEFDQVLHFSTEVNFDLTSSCFREVPNSLCVECHTCRLLLAAQMRTSITPSLLVLSPLATLSTASLASFIVAGLTDADSDRLGLERSLCLIFAVFIF